jgi:WD40 repeat protein
MMPTVPAHLAEATRDFTGRGWVFTKLEEWLRAGKARRMLIVGEAGSGKSALAARLVQFSSGEQDAAAWPLLGRGALSAAHFCRSRVDTTLDPQRVFGALSLQLAERFEPFAKALVSAGEESGVTVSLQGEATAQSVAAGATVTGIRIESLNVSGIGAREAFDRILRRPLEALCEHVDDPVLLLVDSLDEALTYGGDQTLVDVLRAATDDPDELPAHVRVLLTSRPDPRAVNGIADETIDLLADAPPDDHDVRDYVAGRLKPTQLDERERPALADRVATAGKGNFLYARYVLDDLIAHPERLGDADALQLPPDLAGHYREFLTRELAATDQRWQERYQPVLGALAVARGDGLTPTELAGALELRRSDSDRVLRAVAQYLSPADGESRRRLYHQSFREFLTREDEEHRVYPGEASEALADYFIREHSGNWLACQNPYAVAFTASHLVEALEDAEHARERERLAGAVRDLLTDLGYLTARVRLEKGTTGVLEQEYAQAATAAAEDVPGTFSSYADALRRESHVLAERPDDLAVQMANRLDLTDIDGEARPSGPWLRALHPLPVERALRRTLSKHTETAPSVSVTADGSRAASASWDGTICLWEPREGHLIRRWKTRSELAFVALSPDAARAISRDSDGLVVLWDTQTGTEIRTLATASHGAIAVTPAWDALVLERGSGNVSLLRTDDGGVVREWNTGAEAARLAVTPDGTHVVAGGIDFVRTWQLDGEFEPITFDASKSDGRRNYEIYALGVSEDGTIVASGGGDGMLRVWATADRRLLWSRSADSNTVNAVAVSVRQGLAVAGGVAGTIGVYELATGEPLARLRGHTGQIMDLAIVEDGSTLVSAGGEGAVRVWDLAAPRSSPAAVGHADKVTALALSPDAGRVVSGAADGTLLLWSLADGRVVDSAVAHEGGVNGVVFMSDGRIVSCGADSAVRVWKAGGLSPVTAVPVPTESWPEGLLSLVRRDDRTVLVGTGDGRLVAVDLGAERFTVLGTVGDDDALERLAITADGTVAVSGIMAGAIHRWRLEVPAPTPEPLARVEWAQSLVLAADGSLAVIGGIDGEIGLLDLAAGDAPEMVGQHFNYVEALALTTDGALLVAGGWDATLRVWDLASRSEVGRYTWELPLQRAVSGRLDGRDVVVVGDRQGAVLMLELAHG